MRNFNKIAFASALTLSSNVAFAAELDQQQVVQDYEKSSLNENNLARISMLGSTSLLEINEVPEQSASLTVDELLDTTTIQPAERLGNAVQISEPPPPPPPPEPIEPVVIPNFFNWLRISECESGGNWQINTGNGYYGGLQFSLTSWRGAGGLLFAVRPDLATPAEQMLIAENLLDMQGWGAWPACTRKLGIR